MAATDHDQESARKRLRSLKHRMQSSTDLEKKLRNRLPSDLMKHVFDYLDGVNEGASQTHARVCVAIDVRVFAVQSLESHLG